MPNIGPIELTLLAVVCLLIPLAAVALILYLVKRQGRQEPQSAGLDPFGQTWGAQSDGSTSYGAGGQVSSYGDASSYGEVQPSATPHEYGATGGFRRVADQSATVGTPGATEAPDSPRYGYVEPEVLPQEGEPSGEVTAAEPQTADPVAQEAEAAEPPQDTPFAVHAPSDDIEQTIRISRSSGEAEPTAPAWADAISVDEPEPVVEATVRRSDLTFDETPDQDATLADATSAPDDFAAESITAEPIAAEPVAAEPIAAEPTDPAPVESLGDEHTYWDDEEEEQARQAESLVQAEEVVDGGYGWGSAAPFADGSMPPGHPVKGHRDWMQYHEPGSPWYDETTVDVWFTDAAAAERAGFHRA